MGLILISDTCSSEAIAFLQKSGHTVSYQPEITPEQLLIEIPQYEAFVVRSRTIVTKEVIEKASKLRVIARAGSGVDTIDVASAKEKNIIVVNAPGANSEAVAEHTIALLLALMRDLITFDAALHKGRWEKKTYKGVELLGKTLGVIGFGAIGKRVAELARAFGMKIIVHNRTTTGEKKNQLDRLEGQFVSLEELLKTADVVTIHIAKKDETVDLIGEKELGFMKSTAFLINAARGGIVNETALIDALKQKQIKGAALDVFATEPLPADNGFRELENVILTPHIASISPEANARASMMVVEDVDRVLSGKQAKHAI